MSASLEMMASDGVLDLICCRCLSRSFVLCFAFGLGGGVDFIGTASKTRSGSLLIFFWVIFGPVMGAVEVVMLFGAIESGLVMRIVLVYNACHLG
ncbi:hypothetical protein Dimus_005805, partial [Dionaea muscipula]